jgi:uncharacterized membrane protein
VAESGETPARRNLDDESPAAPEQSVPVEVVREIVRAEVYSYHQGPLPDPETYQGYGEVVEDAPERMLSMVEREQGHRHRMELLGQIVGAVAILGALVGGFILILLGYGIPAALFAAAGASPSVYAALRARRRAALEQAQRPPRE